MLPDDVPRALSTLAALLAARPELGDALLAHWRAGGQHDPSRHALPADLSGPADLLAAALPDLTGYPAAVASLAALFAADAESAGAADPTGELLLGAPAGVVQW